MDAWLSLCGDSDMTRVSLVTREGGGGREVGGEEEEEADREVQTAGLTYQ